MDNYPYIWNEVNGELGKRQVKAEAEVEAED